MRVSLVVATIGRIEPLRRLLESLQTQRHQDFTIFLADQNPSGYLDAVYSEFAHLPMVVSATLPRGVSAARNNLLRQADGDIIAFPDDDCFYEPDTLGQVVEFFSHHQQYGAVVARWTHGRPAVNPLIESAVTIRPVTRMTAFRHGGALVQFYRRQAVQAVGEFDETLGPGTGLPWGSGEDTDYLLRAIGAGFLVARCSAIRVYHQTPNLADAALIPKMYTYGLGRMYLLEKHSFPMWFRVANVVYPLMRLPLELPREGWRAARYRVAMFLGRFKGFKP